MFVIKLRKNGSTGDVPRALFSGAERDCKAYVQEVRDTGGMSYTLAGNERLEVVSGVEYFLQNMRTVGGR